jgi:hypothetical protein
MLNLKNFLLFKAENTHIGWTFNAVAHFAQIHNMDFLEALGLILTCELNNRGFVRERYEPEPLTAEDLKPANPPLKLTPEQADYLESIRGRRNTGVKATVIQFPGRARCTE